MEVLIQFDTDGGTEIASQNILYNALVNPVEPPEKEGYSFKGWFFDQEFTRSFDLEKTIEEQCSYTDTITLYAKFLPRLYRVIYDGNGNTSGDVPVDNNLYAAGDKVDVMWNPAMRKNYYELFAWEVTWDINGIPPTSEGFFYVEENMIWIGAYDCFYIGENNVELKAIYTDTIYEMFPKQ